MTTTTTTRIPFEARAQMVNQLIISVWLMGKPRICQTKDGEHFYIKAKINLGKRGSSITVNLWHSPEITQAIIDQALNHKDGDEVIVTGSLDVWFYGDRQYSSISAVRIE
jgi:hypothetical protein